MTAIPMTLELLLRASDSSEVTRVYIHEQLAKQGFKTLDNQLNSAIHLESELQKQQFAKRSGDEIWTSSIATVQTSSGEGVCLAMSITN